ncbi:MAG: tetratricopeptide repeat protein [Phycisphaerales bacterium]|nr:tetratricopeptide repeat protein [Phycisphaerales bacterium]
MKRIFGRRRMSPAEAAALYREGLAAFETGDYERAIERLSQIDDGGSVSSTLAKFYLGQSHMKLGVELMNAGNHVSAIHHFNTARRLNPDAAGLSKYLATCYAAQRKFDRVADEFERSPDSDIDDSTRSIRLAHAMARNGQMQSGIETLIKAIDDAPHRVDVRRHLGMMYAAAEQYVDAVCVFQEAVELAPLDAELRRSFAMALGASEDHAEAAEHLAIAMKLRPNDAMLGVMLAMAMDAAKTTTVKVRIDPATETLELTDDRSIDSLSELIVSEPDFVEAFLALPQTGVDNEVFSLMAGVLERALAANPEFADLHYHCARVYLRLGRLNEAIDEARRAVEINPRYVQALIQLGRLYASEDQTLEARERLSQAILFGGDYPDVHFLIGELYQRDGDRRSAADAYRRALALNDQFSRAREALATVTGDDCGGEVG